MAINAGDYQFTAHFVIRDAMANMTELRQGFLSTFSAMGQAGSTLGAIGDGFLKFGTTAVGAIIDAGVAWGEFERKMDYVAVVANATGQEITDLTNLVMQLGADTIYTNDQIADGFTELAKSGVEAQDIIAGIGEGMTFLGAAADIELTKAATIMMSVVNTWGMAAEDALDVADKLSGAANASSIDMDDLGTSFKYAGSVAAALGIEFDDVNTALALLGKRMIRGSQAGTSMRMMMLSLIGRTGPAIAKMTELGIITEDGTNRFFDQSGAAKSLAEVMDILGESMEGLTAGEKTQALQKIFDTRAMPAALTLIEQGAEGFDKMSKEIEKTVAAEVAAERLNNLAGDIEYLTGEIDNIILSFGWFIANGIRPLVQMLEQLLASFNSLSPGMKELITNATLIASGFSLLVGGFFKAGAGALSMAANVGVLIITMEGLAGSAAKARAIMGTMFKVGIIGVVIALVAALVAGLVYFFTKTEEGQRVWENLKNAVMPVIETIKNAFMGFVENMLPVLETVLNNAISLFQNVGSSVGPIIETIGQFFSQIVDFIAPIIPMVGEFLAGAFETLAAIALPIFQAIIDALIPIGEALAPLGPIFVQAGQDIIAAFQPVAETFMNELLPAFVELGQAIGPFLAKTFESLVTIITPLIPLILNLVSGFAPLVGTILGALIPVLIQLVQILLPAFMAIIEALFPIIINVANSFAPLIALLVAELVPVIQMLVVTLLPVLVEIFGIIAQVVMVVLEALMPLITTIIGLLVPAIEMILNIVVVVFEAIAPIIEAAVEIIVGIIQVFTALLTGDWDAFWQEILQILEGVWNLIVSVITGVVEVIMNIIIEVFSFIATFFTEIWNGIANFFKDIWEGLVNTVKERVENVVTFFRELPEKIMLILVKFAVDMVNTGRDIVMGLVEGFNKAKDAVFNAIAGIVTGAIDWAKGLLGIKSPSKVFQQIGEYVGEGMAIGISGTEKQVTKAMNKMLSSTRKAFQSLVDDRDKAIKKLADLEFQASNQKKVNPNTQRQIAEQKKLIAELNAAVTKQGGVLSKMESINARMVEIANERDHITSRLNAAQKNLSKLESGQFEHYGEFLDEMQKAVSVTSKRTVDGMIYAVENQIEKTKQFNELISDLESRGLDQASLTELIEKFMSDGSMISAQALSAASDDTLSELVNLRKQLGVEAEKVADVTGSIMYDAGIDAAQGLVDGLQAQLDAINAIAQEVADTLTETVKKQLGIKSPSRVTREIGQETMVGLILGVADEKVRLDRELTQIADQIAQFADDVLTTKQFEIETMLTLQATDKAALDMAPINYRQNNDRALLEKLTQEVGQLKTRPPIEHTYNFGDILIPLSDLEQIKTLEDFLEMIRVYKKQGGSR